MLKKCEIVKVGYVFFLAVLAIFGLFSAHLYAHELIKDPIVISLGYRCQPAMQLRFYTIRSVAYPCDWLILPFESLYALLQNDFFGFMDKANLELRLNYFYTDDDGQYVDKKYSHIWEKKYNVLLRHDFKYDSSFLKAYESIKNKYDRRIRRFYTTLASGHYIYFVRQGITKAQAARLVDLLRFKFPQLQFLLVAIDSTQEIQEQWDIPHVKNFYMPISVNPYLRDGDAWKWGEIFKSLGWVDKLLTVADVQPMYQAMQHEYGSS